MVYIDSVVVCTLYFLPCAHSLFQNNVFVGWWRAHVVAAARDCVGMFSSHVFPEKSMLRAMQREHHYYITQCVLSAIKIFPMRIGVREGGNRRHIL